jgi:hypothetical protein
MPTGSGAIKWTRLSCCSFAANAVRLQLHALAYNLGNFLRAAARPRTREWSPGYGGRRELSCLSRPPLDTIVGGCRWQSNLPDFLAFGEPARLIPV